MNPIKFFWSSRMSKKQFLKLIISFSVCVPFLSFALPLGSSFEQHLTVTNYTNKAIVVSDPQKAGLTHYYLDGKGYFNSAYPHETFTNVDGQTYRRTVYIYDAQDDSLICTVSSRLKLTENNNHQDHPESSDENKCSTGVYQGFTQDRMIFGFSIDVR